MRPCIQETLGDNDCGAGTITGRGALEFGEGAIDRSRVDDLVQRVLSLELRVWVSLRMLVRDASDLGEVVGLGTESVIAVSQVHLKLSLPPTSACTPVQHFRNTEHSEASRVFHMCPPLTS